MAALAQLKPKWLSGNAQFTPCWWEESGGQVVDVTASLSSSFGTLLESSVSAQDLLSLSSSLSAAPGGQSSASDVLGMLKSLSTSHTAQANAQSDVSLVSSISLSEDEQVQASTILQLLKSLATSQASQAEAQASAQLGEMFGVQLAGSVSAQATSTLGHILGLISSTGSAYEVGFAQLKPKWLSGNAQFTPCWWEESGGQVVEVDTELDATFSISSSQFFQFQGASQLQAYLGLQTAGTAQALANTILGLVHSYASESFATATGLLSMLMQYGVSGSIVLTFNVSALTSISLGLQQSVGLQVNVDTALYQLLGLSAISQAIAACGLGVGNIIGIRTSGSVVSVELQLPSGRTFVVSVDVRTFTPSTEDRIIAVD